MAKTLLEKAIACHGFIHARHYSEGQIRSHVILPPAGLSDWSTGNHESDALATGIHLQGLSFWWATTKDPKVKAEAKETARGLRKLQRVTKTKACFARGFKRAEGPTWDEQMHFFPREWHQAGKYRWVGDPSTDSLVGIMGGYQAYFELVADQKEKAEVAKDVDIIMGRIVDANMRILDVDGRMTLWGNMCPVVLQENLNALEGLSHLRAAYHMTKKRRYLNEYYRLIEEHDYHKKAALANAQASPPPPHYDWNLATSPLYALLHYEKDAQLLRYYYRALEVQWNGAYKAGVHEPFVNWAYKMFRPKAPVRKETLEWLRTVDVGEQVASEPPPPGGQTSLRQQRKYEVVVDGKPQAIEAVTEGVVRNFLRAYWMGRYYAFIPAEA